VFPDGNRLNAELFEISLDPRLAPRIVFGPLNDQFFDVLSGPWTASFAVSERRGFGCGLANPATYGPWVYDRGQLVECRTQIFGKAA